MPQAIRLEFGCAACGEGNRIECKGGGNKRCVKRNPRPSVLAGILDTYGGLRFVVTERQGLKHHVRPDEILIVVPRLTVHEPIAWDDIPFVIERIRLTVQAWIDRVGLPNSQAAREAVTMYRLRCLEQNQQSLDLSAICET